MRSAIFLLSSLLAMSAAAVEDAPNETLSDASLFASLNIMAVPVGEKGIILKDSQECLWVVRNDGEILSLVALTGEKADKQLCGARP